jgi:hypothetical protein
MVRPASLFPQGGGAACRWTAREIITVYIELEDFIRSHRGCARMTGDAGTVAAKGFLVNVSCSCGGHFERWVAPEEAKTELIKARLLTLAKMGSRTGKADASLKSAAARA